VILGRGVSAFIAGLAFVAIMTAADYTPAAERAENVLYHPFFTQLILGAYFVVPFFLFLGIPMSVLLDRLISRHGTDSRAKDYLFSVGYYVLGGLAAALLLLVLIRGGRADSFAAFSAMAGAAVLASLMLLHVSMLLDAWFGRRRTKKLPSRQP
jgi:cytochrome c oxidase assembly factor CtaG